MRKPERGWIAYVGYFPFPWGAPGSRRMYGIARSLTHAGYRVVVGGGDAGPLLPTPLDCDTDLGTLSFVGLDEFVRADTPPTSKLLRYLMSHGRRTVRWLNQQPEKPSHVVLYGMSMPYLLRLLPWCRRHHVGLVVDVVEWYYPPQFAGGRCGPFYWSVRAASQGLVPRSDGVIAISSHLERYYNDRGCQVLRIPPTLDVLRTEPRLDSLGRTQSTLTLVYAGSPGNKDLLREVIRGVEMACSGSNRIRLMIVGPSENQVRTMLDNPARLPAFLDLRGRVPQQEVQGVVRQADFSVLLRPPLIYAQAGFPTKFVESMAVGVPVIANITSDLGEHLHDGVEGLVCRDHSAQGLADALSRALNLTAKQLGEMRVAARRRAESSFDYRVYAERAADFLEKVRRD